MKKNQVLSIDRPTQVVRQDRVYLKSRNLMLEVGKDFFEVINFSFFGMAFEAGENYKVGDILSGELKYNGLKISDVSLEIKRKDAHGEAFRYGCEALDSVVPIEEINYLDKSFAILDEVNERYGRYSDLPEKVKFYIDDLFIWFSEIEERVKSIEAVHYENIKQKYAAFDNVVKVIGDAICTKLKANNGGLGKLLTHGSDNKITFEYYRYRLGKFIFQSPFTKRSYEKPKGYAGDYEMMNKIYRNDFFANSLFGACMEYAVSMHEEPSAVRNRVEYLSSKIINVCSGKKEKIEILAVASGPAEEIKLAISKLDNSELENITITLLDQDEEALRYAQKNIREHLVKEGKSINIKLMPMDVKELIISGLGSQYHLIYSAGLFDYFSDPVASRAAKALFKSVHSGGEVIIGNFNAEAPNTFGMLALFDWYLILRNDKDLMRIFSMESAKLTIESEPQKVNLFCVIKKV